MVSAGSTPIVAGSLQSPEVPAIEAVLQDYAEGIFCGDVARLRGAFHPDARLFGMVKGQSYDKPLEDYLAVVAARQSPSQLGEPFRMRLLTLEVQGSIALARLHCPMLGFNYLDFLSLRLQGGRWQIVSKLFTHLNHQAFA